MNEVYGFSNINIANKFIELLSVHSVPRPFGQDVQTYYTGHGNNYGRSSRWNYLIYPLKRMPPLGIYEKYENK